ncbi:MAG: beta-galactosidase [Candidatus Baltobacteraceae bacterium]
MRRMLLCLMLLLGTLGAYGHSAVVQQDGYPVFEVDKHPFFVYGAAFFYERIPQSDWERSLQAYKALGINTIDLYLIWNWHELSDGNFDFTGRTNSRRDLHKLFRLIHEIGFKTIVRPGPVIRNEWKNGGYPDWLLRRPEYNMPLHDILEGRYPATATLQNAHSDDAAAEWMNNPVHMKYAPRWLRRVLTEIKPWSSDVIAIALDDDQGAYIDNQTWPAPHFQAYLKFLDSVVHGVTGPNVPTFINTYQMKVTASSPVWAWGNWYQSDAYSIGEHDRSQLEFSTALLQTQPHFPVMVSEFQAGWLQGPDETQPRAADPTNTELAIGTMLQMGAHGIVNFPVQDTWNPSGYEAPFANMFYSWDAALSPSLVHQARYGPTKRMGALLERFGSRLAQTHRIADAAILWTPTSLDPQAVTNRSFYDASAKVIAALQWCRTNSLVCDVLDSHFADAMTRARYRSVIDPDHVTLDAAFVAKLRAASPLPDAVPNVTLLAGPRERFGFLVATNYNATPMHYTATRVRLASHEYRMGAVDIPARSTRLFPIALPTGYREPAKPGTEKDSATWNPAGDDPLLLQNTLVQLAIFPDAGARALQFIDRKGGRNVFTSIGALRDDVADPLPPSNRDYIAKYTHQFPAGTFNRPYAATIIRNNQAGTEAYFSYEAPDLAPRPVTFARSITLTEGSRTFQVSYDADASTPTRTINSITAGNDAIQLGSIHAGGVAVFSSKTGTLATVSWIPSDITDGTFTVKADSAVVILVLKEGATRRVTFGNFTAHNAAEAQAILDGLKGR